MNRRFAASCGISICIIAIVPAIPAQAATPTCFGKPATIIGTEGPDDLVGQSGVADVIYGAGGNDRITGGEYYSDDAVPGRAADLLCGGPGDDRIGGSPGNDKINGGDGNDHINGNLGADTMQGNAGNDTVMDESLADMDSANDIIRGGPGNDSLSNARGVDRVYGDAGNDTFYDAACSTTYLYGGPGTDSFDSWWDDLNGVPCQSQKDYINGGDHADRAKVSKGDSIALVESVTRVPGTV